MKLEVHGNLQGLKQHTLQALRDLYAYPSERNVLLPYDMLTQLVNLSTQIGRELAVYLNRKGQVVEVCVGDSSTVSLAEVKGRKADKRLSGIRCIHTHPNAEAKLSLLDLTSLANLRLDCMAAIGISEGSMSGLQVAYLQPHKGCLGKDIAVFDLTPDDVLDHPVNSLVNLIDKQINNNHTATANTGERAIMVAVEGNGSDLNAEESLDELAELLRTAGAEVLARVVQKRLQPDPATFIGRGKAKELAMLLQELDANCLVFDEELSPAQNRNLEQLIGCKILDRTSLILDIFAARAKTREGKVQVELAQLKYLLPRLTGFGTALSRLGGGIGTRGPGETKLETDRRRIRRRITELEVELAKVIKHRSLQRIGRQAGSMPRVSLVGYTNAGKSSLLNLLTNADVLAENKLFATLDPVTRRVRLSDNRDILLTDTVGFIRKLPHHLVAAFRATLEEVVQADLLIHVVDSANHGLLAQIKAVDTVLQELGVGDKPTVMAFNKLDQLEVDTEFELIRRDFPFAVGISALTGEGIIELMALLGSLLPQQAIMTAVIPFDRGDLLALLHQEGDLKHVQYLPEGVEVKVQLGPRLAALVKPYVVSTEN